MAITRTFRMPVSIFGRNSSEAAGVELKVLGARKVLIVTDENLRKLGTSTRIESSLKEKKLDFEVYDKLPTEPTVDFVIEGTRIFKESECNIILAVGGGTPIDTAKAISVMAINKDSIENYAGANKIRNPGIPVVAIPTTAGTGSEVTIFTIISDTKTNVKMLIASPHLMPRLAIVDPTLTISAPKGITAAVGLDALTHAIEAYVSRKAQPMTDVLALSAIRLLTQNLPQAWANGNDLEARDRTMLASHQAGLAFGNSSVALVHGMSRPIGAYFHVAHGVSNATLLGQVMRFSLGGNLKRYAEIAAVMGEDITGLTDMEAAQRGADAVERMINQLEIPRLRDLGVDRKKFEEVMPQMIEAAIASGSPDNNPRIATKEEIAEIYYQAF